MKTITAKMKAWIPQHSSVSPQALADGKVDGLFYSNADMTGSGWTFAGEAEITVTLVDGKTLVENKVAALRAEATTIRAEATARVTLIEEKIQSLLAIEYQPQQ